MFGLSTVFVVWLKRTHRFMKRLANAQAARRDVVRNLAATGVAPAAEY